MAALCSYARATLRILHSNATALFILAKCLHQTVNPFSARLLILHLPPPTPPMPRLKRHLHRCQCLTSLFRGIRARSCPAVICFTFHMRIQSHIAYIVSFVSPDMTCNLHENISCQIVFSPAGPLSGAEKAKAFPALPVALLSLFPRCTPLAPSLFLAHG